MKIDSELAAFKAVYSVWLKPNFKGCEVVADTYDSFATKNPVLLRHVAWVEAPSGRELIEGFAMADSLSIAVYPSYSDVGAAGNQVFGSAFTNTQLTADWRADQ